MRSRFDSRLYHEYSSLKRKISMVTMVDLRLRPLLVRYIHVSPSTNLGQHNCSSWAVQPHFGHNREGRHKGHMMRLGERKFHSWSLHSLHLHRGMQTLDVPCRAVRYKMFKKIWHFLIWFTFIHNAAGIRLTGWIFLTCIKPKINILLR
jgi:hypothetical protein